MEGRAPPPAAGAQLCAAVGWSRALPRPAPGLGTGSCMGSRWTGRSACLAGSSAPAGAAAAAPDDEVPHVALAPAVPQRDGALSGNCEPHLRRRPAAGRLPLLRPLAHQGVPAGAVPRTPGMGARRPDAGAALPVWPPDLHLPGLEGRPGSAGTGHQAATRAPAFEPALHACFWRLCSVKVVASNRLLAH